MQVTSLQIFSLSQAAGTPVASLEEVKVRRHLLGDEGGRSFQGSLIQQ